MSITREQLKEKDVMVEEFAKLFKQKDYEDNILNLLNTEVKNRKN